ncbi:restriction endonuclease subunit S [Chromobacterium violaceum]|uniref:restriction endonuclease subunit S n=1 Tax=Chromobacterium violaceum TaxID=536 RepID=UPI0009D93756|nr:restriction endonuclease subunit S [Chromobacterium violaceum]OQS26784.1 type I restriction endonuclease subunit S [Chromobacterium violaceum]
MISEWPSKRLGDCCLKIGSGATPKGGKDAYLEHGPFRLIRSQNVYNDGFSTSGLAYIDEDQARKLDGVAVEAGDVLLNITGDSVARVCQAPEKFLPARVNQHVALIRPKKSVFDARFLRYFLASPGQQNFMQGLASAGATRNALTKGMIEDFLVPCPRLEEQVAIAEVLESLDDRITLLRETNATLEAIAQALFKSWFVDFDPVRAKMEGRAPEGMDEATAALFPDGFEESKLGTTPKGWQILSLKQVTSQIFSGGTPDTRNTLYWGGDIPWFSSGETRNLVVIDTEKNITQAGVDGSSTKMSLPGDILIASAGQGHTRGQTSFNTIECYINQSVVAVRASEVSAPAWLFFNLRRRYEEMRTLSDSHSSRGSLTTKILAQMPIVLPPMEIIRAYENVAMALLSSIAANEQTAQTLAAVRDTLLPRLISGQLRLPEAEALIA